MEVIVAASLITALFAGTAALFAPCCIGVLLPAYFASIFKQRKTVFLMTAVFFLGLLAVFLPLGLGVGFIGELFKAYHNIIYIIGSIFLFLLGASLILGFHFSLPFHANSQAKIKGASSVFVLGIFSGFATLCCAPVLAGALALSLLPGSIFWGGVYSFFYVLGMTLPLFIISYFIDKTKIMERMNIFKKEISYSLFGKKIALSVSSLVSGIIFILMSGLIFYYALSNQLMSHSSTQTSVNIFTAQITDFVLKIPLWLQVAFIAVIVALIILTFFLIIKRQRSE